MSLTDELAADSLDLLELVLATETEFGIAVPERALADVRTYGDLVATVIELMRGRRPAALEAEPASVRTRVIPAGAEGTANVERAVLLTPYVAQTIVDDALHAGRGARLEVEVPAGTSDVDMAAVQERFARLGERGVQVCIRRRAGFGPPPTVNAAASASR